MTKKKTLNELRQTKDYGYTKHYNTPEKPKTGVIINGKTKLVSYEEKNLMVEIKKLHIERIEVGLIFKTQVPNQ